MKFSKSSQLVLVSCLGLLAASLLTACQIVTADYVFVANNASVDKSANGQIAAFALDSETGALRKGGTAVGSGGVSPVALASTSDYAHLYVANADSSNIVHMTLAGTGALTAKDTVTLPSTPVAMAVNQTNTFLYAVSGASSATLTVFPIKSGALGAAVDQVSLTLSGFPGDTIVPTGVFVLANGKAVFVTAYDQSAYNPGGATPSTANPGWIYGFAVGSSGALAPATGSPWKAGVKPSALAADPTNRFVYVTDFASNELIGYSIYSESTLQFLINGPFRTGSEPAAIVVDPRGKYIYVANSLDATVTGYQIDLATGTPSAVVNVTGSQNNSTGAEPVSIALDPSEGRYVYTANLLDNSVSGFRLDPSNGTLKETQANPYPTGTKPTAVLIVPHGNHATQFVTP
ncbi:MAG: beta-propeller fold lactonase family protein [Terracidiphilus sp.]